MTQREPPFEIRRNPDGTLEYRFEGVAEFVFEECTFYSEPGCSGLRYFGKVIALSNAEVWDFRSANGETGTPAKEG